MMASDGGKGDKQRPADAKAFGDNYDAIFRKPTSQQIADSIRSAAEEQDRPKNIAASKAAADGMRGKTYGIIKMASDSGLTDPDLGVGMTDYGDATDAILEFAKLITQSGFGSCKNCKHYTDHIGYFQCTNFLVQKMVYGDSSELRFEDDFGCNKWEAKP